MVRMALNAMLQAQYATDIQADIPNILNFADFIRGFEASVDMYPVLYGSKWEPGIIPSAFKYHMKDPYHWA